LPASAWGTGRQDLFKDWDPKRDVSDYYTATLRYKSGLILTWTHTWAAPPNPQFAYSHEQLIGPKGGIDLSKGLVAFRKGAAPARTALGAWINGQRGRSLNRLALPPSAADFPPQGCPDARTSALAFTAGGAGRAADRRWSAARLRPGRAGRRAVPPRPPGPL